MTAHRMNTQRVRVDLQSCQETSPDQDPDLQSLFCQAQGIAVRNLMSVPRVHQVQKQRQLKLRNRWKWIASLNVLANVCQISKMDILPFAVRPYGLGTCQKAFRKQIFPMHLVNSVLLQV